MAQTFVELSSTVATDRLATRLYAGRSSVHLSDGSMAFLESDGTNYFLKHSGADHATVTSIATLVNTNFAVAAPAILVVDNLDNLYVIGSNGSAATKCQAFTKGGGYSWTAQTTLTPSSTGNANSDDIDAVWCNTGGGTNSKGHILLGTVRTTAATNPIYWIFDAGVALAGAGTLQTASGTGPAFLNTAAMQAANLSLSADGFGATNGIAACRNIAAGNIRVGAWSVSSAGALVTNINVGTTTGTATAGQVRAIRYAANAWAVISQSATATRYSCSRWSASALLTAATDCGTPTNMPLTGATTGWDAFADPLTANKVWVIALGTLSGTNLPLWRVAASVASGVTWDAAATADDTLTNVNTKQDSLRVIAEPRATKVDWQSWQKISGTNWALDGDFTQFSTPPNAPTDTAPANGAYVDVAATPPTYTGTYNSTDGANANARALRLKTSGGGSYNYWNAGTSSWQSTIVWNAVSIAPAAAGSFGPISAGVSNGNVYNWAMADQEAGANLQGPFAADLTFNAQAGPVVVVTAPTGTVTTSNTPAATWTTTPGAGAAQTAFRVVVEHGAYGSAPGSGTQDWDSGTINGSDQSRQIGVSLANGTTYRVFVQVTETGGLISAWAFSTFTISLDLPAQPTITAVADVDGVTGCPRCAVTVQGRDNLLTAVQASFEDGTTTGWAAGANTAIANSVAQALDGTHSMSLTSAAAGNVSATTPTGTSGFAVAASQQITALASFRSAVSARSANIQVLWYKAGGAASSVRASDTSGNITTTTSGWTQASLTVTAPSDAVTAAIVVTVLATAAASEVHYVDQIDYGPGASTLWTRGGLVGSTVVVVTRSDGVVLRPAAGTALPSGTQTVTIFDYEPTPGTAYTYTAVVSAIVGGSTISSSASAASGSVTITTTGWWMLDPTSVSGAMSPVVLAFTAPRFEQAAARPALGQTTALITSDVMMGSDGTMSMETFDAASWTALQALLTSQKTLFVSSPFNESYYGRFGLQPSASGSAGGKPREPQLLASQGSAPHRTLSTTFVAQPRPAP